MQVHLINLDRSASRLVKFRTINGHLSEISRFSAIDGQAIDIPQLIRAGGVEEDILTTYTRGAIGAAMSHIALWDVAVSKGEPITICEDDAVFNLFFDAQAPSLLDGLPPNWDFALWGWNFDASLCFEFLPGVSSLLARFEQNRLRKNSRLFRRLSMDTRMYPLKSFFGLACYSISPKGAAAIKAACLPLKARVPCLPVFEPEAPSGENAESIGIDTAINSVISRLSSYVCFPPLVVSKNEFEKSTIQRGT